MAFAYSLVSLPHDHGAVCPLCIPPLRCCFLCCWLVRWFVVHLVAGPSPLKPGAGVAGLSASPRWPQARACRQFGERGMFEADVVAHRSRLRRASLRALATCLLGLSLRKGTKAGASPRQRPLLLCGFAMSCSLLQACCKSPPT